MIKNIKTFIKKLNNFLTEVANDTEIPERDKKILLAMIALILSPIDIIPDWVPVFGMMDDAIILAVVLDYFFAVLDSRILLRHFPWDMKSFARLRRIARVTSFMVPGFIKNNIWKYKKDAYS